MESENQLLGEIIEFLKEPTQQKEILSMFLYSEKIGQACEWVFLIIRARRGFESLRVHHLKNLVKIW